jgi:flagellar FliL protein
MSAPADAPVGKKPKSKMLLIIALIALIVLAAGAGAFVLLKGDEQGEDAEASATQEKAKPKPKKKDPAAAPTFMPLDAVVVNLADPGTTRYAQVGLTLQLEDAKTADEIKKYMPAIRNGILMLISRRTADELLSAEGKSKLAEEILEMVQKTTDMEPYKGYSPVEAVLFSSIIVQ